MDSKQIYKKPTNFSEVLELQKILDGKINNFSERDIRKIQLSLIAELIELNEELECTHKTWKKKEFDIGKQKEEAVDVFFFLAQLINFIDVDKIYCYFNDKNLINYTGYEKDEINSIIFRITENFRSIPSITMLENIISYIFILTNRIGIKTNEELYLLYYKKWQINMDRVDKKVDDGGWN